MISHPSLLLPAWILASTCGLFFATVPLHSQTPTATKSASGSTAREPEDLVKIVEKDLGKLRSGSKKEEAAMEISKTLNSAEVNKVTTLRFKVDSVNPWHFPGPNVTGWRVEAGDAKFREGGVNFDVNLFAHFKEDPSGMVAKLKKGQEIVVSGKVTRCDITAMQRFVLHVDIGDAKLEIEKK